MVIHSNSNIGTTGTTAGKAKQSTALTTPVPATETKNTTKTETDSVSLSQQAQNIAKIEANIAKLPDIDSAKVAEVKAALESGSYQIDDYAIAGKMLAEDKFFS